MPIKRQVAKHKIGKLLKPIETGNENIIWVKIKSQYLNSPNDILRNIIY